MKFSVVGNDSEAIELIKFVHQSDRHQVVGASTSGELAAAMAAHHVACGALPSPEEAITVSEIDAVIVAFQNADQSIAVCRQASQLGRHVIVIPPQDVSTAFSFELHLLLDESEHGIVPCYGRCYFPAESVRIRDSLVRENIRQLSLRMSLPESQQMLARIHLHGVDALMSCGFRFTRVTALDVAGANGELLTRSITLAAADSDEARMPPAMLTLGSDGPVKHCGIEVHSGESEPAVIGINLPVADRDSQSHLQADFEALIVAAEDRNRCERQMEAFSDTLEVLAGLEKSLRRRRTVDIFFDGVSERGAFKTQMTAIGCGVLTYMIVGLIAFLALGQIPGIPPLVLKIARVFWIAPVVLFLLAQLLLPLARDRDRTTTDERK